MGSIFFDFDFFFSWGMQGGALFPYGALVERARRLRRADQFSPNESSVAHMRAELWPQTLFLSLRVKSRDNLCFTLDIELR